MIMWKRMEGLTIGIKKGVRKTYLRLGIWLTHAPEYMLPNDEVSLSFDMIRTSSDKLLG